MARLSLLHLSSGLLALLLASPAAAEGPAPQVPPGFTIERAAGAPEVVFPMFAAFDERGRLFVAESSGLDLYAELTALTKRCRVSLLEDRDGDGRFETSRVFAEGLVFPMGLAFRDGKLYVADPPALVALEDTGGDGRADRRTVVLESFGHRDNGSLHGLVFGPDSLLYMTTGSPDGYRFRQEDGSDLHGESGALLRSRPDGSRPEVLSRGFENLVEVAFLPTGEIIGTDNWFQLPSGGARDALVHLLPGGLYPRHADRGSPEPLTGVVLPPVALFPAVALSGLLRYRGAAFPREMQGNLFSAQHNARRVARHVLERQGSTFRSESFDFVASEDPDFHPSDVLESADGSLLVVDTGGWYVQHCPTGKIRNSRSPGGIYRVRARAAAALPDPWGLRIAWKGMEPEGLAALLRDPRPAVRDLAQRESQERGKVSIAALTRLLDEAAPFFAREHAVWALASIPDPAALPPLRRLLGSAEPELVSLAARALLRREDRDSAPALSELLRTGSPPVRLAAAEALAGCGTAASLPAIWTALAREPDRADRHLEHALVHAAHRLAGRAELEAALDHPHPRVEKAAMWLLDQPPRSSLSAEAVVARLSSGDPELREAALALLARHPEWKDRAAAVIGGWLERAALSPSEELALGGLILAFEKSPRVEELVAASIRDASGRTSERTRLILVSLLSRSGLKELPGSWLEALRSVVGSSSPPLRMEAVRSAAALQVTELDGEMARILEDEREPAELRLEALRALAPRRPHLEDSVFRLLLSRLGSEAAPASRLLAGEALSRSRLDDSQARLLLQAARGDPLVGPALVLPALEGPLGEPAAGELLAYLEDALEGGYRPREEELKRSLRLLGAEGSPGAERLRQRADRLVETLREKTAGDRARLAGYERLLEGGSPERGRTAFLGKKAGCFACHRIGAEGGQVGPDLTRVGAVRSGRDLLESIIIPSSTFAQGYESWSVVTGSGQILVGIIARQTEEILVLKDQSGAETVIPRERIRSLARQEASLMPEGLERALAPEELRDLLSFLKSLR
jgi:putative membrane-bound dehydrogenase-like protein